MRAKFSTFMLIGIFCALFFLSSAQAAVTIGQPAPALVTSTLEGKDFDLATLKGKVVVIHFWATWCAPCREEMPSLEAVWRQYHGKGLEVLAISADRPRAHADVDQVMHYFTFPAAMFTALAKNDFGTPSSIPVTYIIGKTGNVEAILTPDTMPLTEQALGEQVRNLLEAKTDIKPEVKSDASPDAKTEAKP